MKYLSLITFIPAVALCVYIYIKDRAEKEPFKLLLILFFSGVAVCVPAKIVSDLLIGVFDGAFADQVTFSVSGTAEYSSPAMKNAHDALCAFVAAALPEELFKWLPLFFITRKNKNFDCLFDGIVYYVFLSAGFAVAENIMRIYTDGTDTLLIRAFMSVPAHLLFGVMAGFFYTLWHTYKQASEKENELIISKAAEKKKIVSAPLFAILSLAAPVAIHAVYTFTEISGENDARLAYYLTVMALYAVCFAVTHAVSRRDGKNTVIADAIVSRAHPGINAGTEDKAE